MCYCTVMYMWVLKQWEEVGKAKLREKNPSKTTYINRFRNKKKNLKEEPEKT